jgi:hypothetical protein
VRVRSFHLGIKAEDIRAQLWRHAVELLLCQFYQKQVLFYRTRQNDLAKFNDSKNRRRASLPRVSPKWNFQPARH